MRTLLGEPLLQFILIGAALFGAYASTNQGIIDSTRQVHIAESEVQWLKQTWARQWRREPGRDELRGLVTDYLKEELLAREAREMGLDQDDTIIRRRLAQKIEFLVQDASRLAEPTEEDLRAFYTAHPELFSEDERVSFTQVYFRREHHAESVAARDRIEAGADPRALGDRLLVESDLQDATRRAVAAQFGEGFAGAVFGLAAGAWHGPIESGYGIHLVRVSGRTPARLRDFGEVHTQVAERWRDDRQREDNEKYFAGLLKKYDVVLDESVKPLVGTLEKVTFVQ